MKVVTINGQNHKGSTYHIGRMPAEKLTDEKNIFEIFLPRDMPHFCCGCTQCFMKGEENCPHYDKLKPLTEQMDRADVLIFTSPVYVFHATGSMKAFLDHYGYRWMVHRPEGSMFRKQAVVIATAAGGGMKSTCKDMKDTCSFWGIPKIYKIGLAVRAIKWSEVPGEIRAKAQRKTDRVAARIQANRRHMRLPLKNRMLFYVMRIVQRKGFNEADALYWKEKGWTKDKRPWT